MRVAHLPDRLQVGYVPQKVAVDWTLPLTVGRFMALTDRITAHHADETLAKPASRIYVTLKCGRCQGARAMLARAIARKPDLLVLDEPVQGVDFNGEIVIYELIKPSGTNLTVGSCLFHTTFTS